MRQRPHLLPALLVAACVVGFAHQGAAQGQVGGTVKDASGGPVKGATVQGENPEARPSSFTATTDDKGRWVMIGLRSGDWTFTVRAPGYSAQSLGGNVKQAGTPPIHFTLAKSGSGSGLGNVNAKDVQAELGKADELYNSQQWDAAIAAYRALLVKVPALSSLNLQIGAAYRNKKDYEGALAAYNDVLKADPNNEAAKVNIGMTNLEKGDLKAAEETLTAAAASLSAGREVFYNLGEVKFSKGETDEAAKWYQRAADTDPAWGKPLFKLALVALNKGDKDGSIKMLEKVISVEPMSAEATQAKAVIEQLKK